MNACMPGVGANTAHWRRPVLQWKFPLLQLPSVQTSNLLPSMEAPNLLPSVQASICFPFVMEDRRKSCKFGEVRGSAWQPVEGLLARVKVHGAKWTPVDVSGPTWTPAEVKAAPWTLLQKCSWKLPRKLPQERFHSKHPRKLPIP